SKPHCRMRGQSRVSASRRRRFFLPGGPRSRIMDFRKDKAQSDCRIARMSMRIRCTACSALLQLPDEHAGKRIRCPKCKEPTVATPIVEKPAADKPSPASTAAIRSSSPMGTPRPAAVKTASAPSRRTDDFDEEDETPRPRKKKKKKRKDHTSLIVGAAVAG